LSITWTIRSLILLSAGDYIHVIAQTKKKPDEFEERAARVARAMFNKNFAVTLAHSLANRYFPKKDDLIVKDTESTRFDAKRIIINALQAGVDPIALEELAKKANSVSHFNSMINNHRGIENNERKSNKPYIEITKKEVEVLKKVFHFSDEKIERLTFGELSQEELDLLYDKLDIIASRIKIEELKEKNSRDFIIQVVTLRWGLDDGIPKNRRIMASELGLTDNNHKKINDALSLVFGSILDYHSARLNKF